MSGPPQPETNPSPSWPADWLNQIHHGDCLELLAQLPDECVDLVVTSPPYNLRSGSRCRGWPGYDGYGDDRPHDEYVAWQQECLREMYRVIKPTGAIFYNHAPRIHNCVQWRHEDILEPFDVRQTVIWHRAGGVNHNPQYLSPSYEYIYVMAKPGFRVAPDWTMGDVWKMQQEKKRWIPEVPAFPVQLPQNAIRATGAKVVLDCFMGSGTTAVAAVLEGADYIGIEQSARYCAVARERVASIPPGGEPVEPSALYTKSRLEPGRAELRGNAGVVYKAIRERIEAAGLHEITRSQVSLAQEIGMNLKTLWRAIQRIRAAGVLVICDRGSSTSYALPMNGQPVGQPAALVTDINSAHMDIERVPMDVPMAAENVHMDIGRVPIGVENVHMDTPYRFTGTDLPINSEDTKFKEPDRMTGSDVPMNVPMVDVQRASPESAWPSGNASNPASAWRAVLGRLQLELPLHQAMAQEALVRTLGYDANIIWNVMPSLVQANQEGNPTVDEPPPEEPEYCPEHPEPHLRARSSWYSAREVEKENDDEIYYCKGGGGQCTWVYSVKEGCIWKELADELLKQAGLRNAYHAKKYLRTQATRTRREL